MLGAAPAASPLRGAAGVEWEVLGIGGFSGTADRSNGTGGTLDIRLRGCKRADDPDAANWGSPLAANAINIQKKTGSASIY